MSCCVYVIVPIFKQMKSHPLSPTLHEDVLQQKSKGDGDIIQQTIQDTQDDEGLLQTEHQALRMVWRERIEEERGGGATHT